MRTALVAVAGIAAMATACPSSKSPKLPAPGTSQVASSSSLGNAQPLTKTAFAGLVLTHPTNWIFVPIERPTAGPSGELGFLSSEPAQPQCKDVGHAVFRCGAPVARLASGAVLLTVSARLFGSTQITPNSRVANLPSQLSTHLTPSECPAGTGYEESAVVNLPRGAAAGTLWLTACAADSDTPTRSTISQVFTSATYRH
jgi:hypothetical protein